MKRNDALKAFLSFAMYFLAGSTCVMIGSTLPQLVQTYGQKIELVGLLGSAYALGRILTVNITGVLVEKIGSVKVLGIGTFITGIFMFGIPTIPSFVSGLILAFAGGIAFGTQDAACPTLLSSIFKKNYESSLTFGQGLFGVGTTVSPFVLGLFLSGKLSYAWSYYVLGILSFIICAVSFIVKDTSEIKDTEKEEEHIRPLYAKSKILAYAGIVISVAAFSGVSTAIGMYTTSFAITKGISESNAAFMFTLFNLGCVLGGFLFTWILRYVKGTLVLLMNCIGSFIAILAAMLVNTALSYYIGLFVAGLFLGVLFSVIVAIASRIMYKRVSIACSIVASASGVADMLTPIVVGAVISQFGVGFSYTFGLIMLAICITSAALLKIVTFEDTVSIN